MHACLTGAGLALDREDVNNYIKECIQFSYMFYNNPELLQRNLHSDLNTIIKNVKAREDQYLTLLQYNKNLIANISQIENMSFFMDQVNKHKAFLASSQSSHQKIVVQQQQIKEKYEFVTTNQSSIVKLLGRVTSRLIQICQASMEKGKYLDTTLAAEYGNFKAKLMENLNNSNKINLQDMLGGVIAYSVGKDKRQIDRLSQIINILVNGEFQKLAEVYQPRLSPDKKRSQSPEKPHPPQFSTHSSQKSLQKPKHPSPDRRHIQQQRQQVEKTKKKKAKVAKQLYTNMYSIMDLSKQQFMDDISYGANQDEKKKRLFEEIFSRNKFNYEQILEFESKKEEFAVKVKEFKEMMQAQSRKIQQALVIVINKPIEHKPADIKISIKTVQRKQTKSDAGDNDQDEVQSPQRIERLFRRRDMKQPVKANSPRFIKEVAFSSMQSTQQGFQHIKFDIKNEEVFMRSNRARLPQIPGRSSLDNRYEQKNGSRISQKKQPSFQNQAQRINIMKNVQIGLLNTSVAKNSITDQTQQQQLNNFLHQATTNKKSPRDRQQMDPLFQNVLNSNLGNSNNTGSNGLDFTFYARKKVTKFYETRNNFVL